MQSLNKNLQKVLFNVKKGRTVMDGNKGVSLMRDDHFKQLNCY